MDWLQTTAPITQANARLLERFNGELTFARQLCTAHPAKAAEWQERIGQAERSVSAGLAAHSVDVKALIAAGEEILRPIGAVAKTYTLMCVSHAHIDMNWMWSWPETVAVTHDTFRTMLALIDEYPAFIFSQSQASTYNMIEKYNPAMFEAIRARVAEKRWEVTASQWVEGDKNMASGESLSRHLLYTREYFQEKFGLGPDDVRVDFEPDTFGHPATLPTILARGGVKYYYHCRGSYGTPLYWWRGPDGSRLLVYNDITWYNAAIEPKTAGTVVDFERATGLRYMPVLYGVGDHGGGPTRRDLNRMLDMDTWPVYPNVKFATFDSFFAKAEAEVQGLPELSGERNFIFTGCYTTQARQKWANRHGENLLYAAEVASTLGQAVAGVPYPKGNLEQSWRDLLLQQFHDILPGSGVRDTRHYAMGKAQDLQAAAAMARSNALRALAARIDTCALLAKLPGQALPVVRADGDGSRAQGAGVGYGSGSGYESAINTGAADERAFVVFNPLPYARQTVAEAKLWDNEYPEEDLVVTESEGAPRRLQVLDSGNYWGHSYRTVAFPVEVPALGYRTFCISGYAGAFGLPVDQTAKAESLGAWRTVAAPEPVLENEYLRVRLDAGSGAIASLLDKRSGREWVPEGGLAGLLQYGVEANIGMTAWVIGPWLKRQEVRHGGQLKRLHRGPYVQTYRWTNTVSNSKLQLDITLRQGVPRVEFRLQVDWREMGSKEGGTPHLRVLFPMALEKPQARYEVPYGSIVRDLRAGEEMPALRWVDLSADDGAGVTLANSSKYGFGLDGATLSMTILRASIDPDPLPDMGEHVVEYALVPHGTEWTVADSVAAGEEINIPMTLASCGFQNGPLPNANSYLSMEPQNVRLVAMKPAQDGQGLVFRLVEVEGLAASASLHLAPALAENVAGAVEVSTLEQPADHNTATWDGSTVRVDLPAYGIATVKVG